MRYALADLEVIAEPDDQQAGPRDDEWYEVAEYVYDMPLLRPGDLPALLGVAWDPYVAGDLIYSFATESQRFGGRVPDALFQQQIADAIYPDPRWGKLVLRVVSKDVAYDFIRTHHSALGSARLPPGLMYAVGAYQPQPFAFARLVAVAIAGQPTGNWPLWLPERPVLCHRDGILDLTRVASIGGLHTTDRRGRRVPLSASSMLTARMMDLLPLSGRHQQRGCLFVTYSLTSEKGTTYLSLVSKGLRPVARTKPKHSPTGARKGGAQTALGHLPKVRWEYGPAALPPNWHTLDGVTSLEAIARARREFDAWQQRQ